MVHPILTLALLPIAHAEGSAELGPTQPLQGDVVMAVDILAPGESIDWFGESRDPNHGPNVAIDLEISDPVTGAVLGILHSGDNSGPMPVGTWKARVMGVDLDGDGIEEALPTWDLSVPGAVGGRVSSTVWEIRGPDFSEASRFDGSFYALLNGGSPTETLVVEMKMEGLVGRVFFVKINSNGIYHFPGRSCPIGAIGADGEEAIALAEFPIYLNPPEIATYSTLIPEITNIDTAVDQCSGVSPGVFPAKIEFDTNVDGQIHLVCDLNGDGLDPASEEDIHIQQSVRAGHRRILWDGMDRDGNPVAPGTYDCQLRLTVGEFHFVANDVETAFAGLRLFEVDASADRRGLAMFWEDSLVQDADVVMPNGQSSLESSGPTGIESGRYNQPAVANVNARSWGNFTFESKGNDALLDTWTSVREAIEPFTLVVLDPDRDRDGDGLVDATETCQTLTDPTLPDTDGDGLDDRFETEDSESDALDTDSDDDGLLDSAECDASEPRRDSDADGTVDWADTDDDNDLVPTLLEDWDGDGDWTDEDVDGDGIPAWLDRDNDGDELHPEDTDGDGDPTNNDNDADGVPDTNDPDDDDDGIPTVDEAGGDHDGDGIIDRYDPDDDGDGIPTLVEGTGDLDGDGRINALDTDDDGDRILSKDEYDGDTDGDGDADAYDDDDDGDGISTRIEQGVRDTDGDGTLDFRDTDSDDDGLSDAEENAPGGTYVETDSDGDHALDYRDDDDDDDRLPTRDEHGVDTDGDGVDDHLDSDDDDDGLATRTEVDDGTTWGTDIDGDGVFDWLDLDSDGDGIPDEEEVRKDADGDSVPDYLDPLEVVARTGEYLGGCDTSGSGGAGVLGLMLLPLALRRRR